MINSGSKTVNPSYRIFAAVTGIFATTLLIFGYTGDYLDILSFEKIVVFPIDKSKPSLSDNMVKHRICLCEAGGMGNLMFQYASTYGIARSKGMRQFIPHDFPLQNYFNLTAEIYRTNSTICDPVKTMTRSERQACTFDKNLVNFNNTQDVRVALYLQSYLYFNDYSEELRKEFVFKNKIRQKAKTILEDILRKNKINRKNVTLIGVHVRRGDYVNNPAGYNVADKKYLHKAVTWYLSKFKNIHFIVASNGLDWTKKNMPTNISVSYLSGNTREVDMAVLSSTNHFITTAGTFSWWSGWLTGGNVTYFKWPVKEKTPLRTVYSKDFSDFFPPSWVGF